MKLCALGRRGDDRAVGVVIGALLLTVILFAALSAYILYYVPSTAYSNETASLVSEQNGFMTLSQKVNSAPYPGSIITGNIPLGFGGVPPFSAFTPGTLSYSNNTSVFQAYLNYTYSVNLVNSTISSILQPNQVAVLPITITSTVTQNTPFDERIVVDSAAYKGLEAQNLTNIFFTYSNGTVIPSWLENNNTNSSTSTTYWLYLDALGSNTQVTVDMVFLPTSIDIMNTYQTGEASQLSPIFGQYNDMRHVFGSGLAYQIYFDQETKTIDSTNHQINLYQASIQNGTVINYLKVRFRATTNPFYTPIIGSNQPVYRNTEPNVIINYQEGYSSGSAYPNPPVTNTANSWLIKMIGFAQLNSSSTIYGGTDDGMSIGYSVNSSSSSLGESWLNASIYDNLFNNYYTQEFTVHSGSIAKPGTYSFNMNYFEDGGAAYTAVWSNNTISYYHPIFPAGSGYPSATFGNVSIENLTSVPITIANNQSSSEPNVYQQRLVINNAQYQSKEAANLQNIIFDYPNGTIIPSWLETGNSNSSAQTEYWLSMAGIPSDSSITINMLILPQQFNMFNNFRTGESPQFSSGAYDDGSHVFAFYDAGNDTSQFSTVNSGSFASSSHNGPFGSKVSVLSLAGLTTKTSSTSSESVAWINKQLGGNVIIQSWVYLNGNENAMMAARGATNTSDTNYLLGDGWAGRQAEISYESGSTNDYLSSSGSRGTTWCFVSSELNGSKLSVVVSKGPLGVGSRILAQTAISDTRISPLNNKYDGIGVWSGSGNPAYFYLLKVITLPANGVMPNVTIGQKISNATNNNAIIEHSNLHIYGNFNSVIGSFKQGTSLYLADGSVVLSSGTMKLIGNIIPVNVVTTSNGVNLSLSAVNIIGSNISTSADGSSLIRLSNINSTALSYFKGEELNLLYHDSIPFTAQVGSINLTSLSYVVTGFLAPAFNSTLYSLFGNGLPVSSDGQWYMGSGVLKVTSTQNVLSIALNNSFALLDSININYEAYTLLDI